MKLRILLLLMIFSNLFLSASTVRLKLHNTRTVSVNDYPVVIKLADYQVFAPEERADLAVFVDGEQISSQLDDLNNDGVPDELVFLLNFKPGEKRKILLKTIKPQKRTSFPAEVYADLIVKDKDGTRRFVKEVSSTKNDMYNALHHHGVAFESALIAYRIYFDNKSTIDVYGKKKQQLEIATTGWYPTEKQLEQGFGDDILLVSGWVGVGTVKGWDGRKATHIDKFDKRTQRIVALGNLRAIVESEVKGWKYEGKSIDITVRYIIYARHRDAVCQIVASEDIDNLATGVQQIGGGELLKSSTLVGSWGCYFPQPDSVKFAKETAGLGVYVPEIYQSRQVQSGVDNLIVFPYKKAEVLQFYFTAAALKEEKSDLKTAESFFAYLKKWSDEIKCIK